MSTKKSGPKFRPKARGPAVTSVTFASEETKDAADGLADEGSNHEGDVVDAQAVETEDVEFHNVPPGRKRVGRPRGGGGNKRGKSSE